MNKYTILSDFHLGSEVCQRDKIINVLKNLNTENIILLGDIIDINHTKRLKKKDWEILSILRKLSKHTNIIYTAGNHDSDISPILCELLGFKFMKNLDINVNDKSFHLTHGDFFDIWISKFWLVTEIATSLYYWIQRFDTKRQLISRSLKKNSKSFIKCCENMKKRAERFADLHGYSYIICGHSHHHYFDKSSKYIDTGCFTEIECSYVVISKEGQIQLKIV